MGCMGLGLVSILVPLWYYWVLLDLQASVRCFRSLLSWLRWCLDSVGATVLPDLGTSTFWRRASRAWSLHISAWSLRGLHWLHLFNGFLLLKPDARHSIHHLPFTGLATLLVAETILDKRLSSLNELGLLACIIHAPTSYDIVESCNFLLHRFHISKVSSTSF